MDKSFQKKNKKWIIYVSVIVLLALLLAFGPVFFARYMRSKDNDMADKLNTVKTRLKVKGVLKVYDDYLYLLGNNTNIYLIIGSFVDELKRHLEEEVTIMGPILPSDDMKIEGKEVRFVINVDKYGFPDLETNNLSEEQISKINRRTNFVDDVNTKLKKRVRYDAIKGKIEVEEKLYWENEGRDFPIIKDEFGDTYVLVVKNFDAAEGINDNVGKVVVCLGRTAIYEDIPLNKDEVVFEVFEVYDENLNKIK